MTRVKMINKRYAAPANVLPEDVPVWEAAGWVKASEPKKESEKK
jgi:hypothetical protein